MIIVPKIIDYFFKHRKKWENAYFGTGAVGRIPTYAQLHEYAMSQSSLSGKDFYTNVPALVRWEAREAYDIGLDIPDITFDCYNIEVEALGGEVKYFEDKAPELVNVPVTDKIKLLQLDSPEPLNDGRMPFVLEVVETYEELFGHFPRLNVTAPFTLAAKLRGVQQFLMDIIRDKSFVKDLLNFVTNEVLVPYIKAIHSTSNYEGEIIAADAVASPPNLDLDLLEELALEPLLDLKEKCRKDVTILNWWGESQVKDPERLMELKIRASSGKVLEGQDPDVDKVGPELYCDFASEKGTSLILGVGTEIMMLGDQTSVKKRVERYLRAGRKIENGFLLYFTNFVGDTPQKNIQAAIEAVNRFES